jgi:hypothetical protein
MIQRKQTLWLFLAALLNAGVLYFPLYKYTMVAGSPDLLLRVSDHYPSLILAVVMIFIPVVTIFLFGNRKQQMRLTIYSIVAELAFIGTLILRTTSLNKQIPAPISGSYWIGSILPVIALVLLFMAIAGIRKDEKLVKSVDRLR